jgi:hypothetical protein
MVMPAKFPAPCQLEEMPSVPLSDLEHACAGANQLLSSLGVSQLNQIQGQTIW